MSDTILKGIRVIETARFVAAPMCARILAGLGAEVIKVETNKPMDMQRLDADNTRDGYRWADSAALKKSASLSLKFPEAIEIMKKLLAVSDVFIENMLPDGPAKLGLDYDEIRKNNPGLIIMRMPGLGIIGPYRDFVAYGLSVQALGGLDDVTGLPGSPIGPNFSYPDYVSGMHAALSVLAALDYRRRTGKGQIIEAPLYMAMSSLLGSAPLEYSANNLSVKGIGNLDRYMFPHNSYKCKGEDRWCAIAVSTDDEWKALCKVVGNPALSRPEYDTVSGRKKDYKEIDKQIETWTLSREAPEVFETMQKAGVPAGIVAKGSDLMEDPQLKAREYFKISHNHPRYGDHPNYSVPPIVFSGTPCAFGPAPKLGEHNGYVFGELLGMSKEEIQKYTEAKIFD